MCHFQRREFRLTNILLNVWPSSKAHAKNFHGGFFIQWHVVVICIWFELFVTSQFDVIFMFSNQHFGEGCCHNMHIILFYTHFILRVIVLNIKYQRSKLGHRRKIHSTLRHSSS